MIWPFKRTPPPKRDWTTDTMADIVANRSNWEDLKWRFDYFGDSLPRPAHEQRVLLAWFRHSAKLATAARERGANAEQFRALAFRRLPHPLEFAADDYRKRRTSWAERTGLALACPPRKDDP